MAQWLFDRCAHRFHFGKNTKLKNKPDSALCKLTKTLKPCLRKVKFRLTGYNKNIASTEFDTRFDHCFLQRFRFLKP